MKSSKRASLLIIIVHYFSMIVLLIGGLLFWFFGQIGLNANRTQLDNYQSQQQYLAFLSALPGIVAAVTLLLAQIYYLKQKYTQATILSASYLIILLSVTMCVGPLRQLMLLATSLIIPT